MRRADGHARAIGLWGSFKGWLKRIQTKRKSWIKSGAEASTDVGNGAGPGAGAGAWDWS